MSVLVIRCPLLRICKYFVSFFCFLEVILRFGIIRISVWMVFHREPAIGFFYVLFAAVAVNAQHFIVIAFAHIGFLENWKRRGSFNARYLASPMNAKTQDAPKTFNLFSASLRFSFGSPCLLLVLYFLKLGIHYFAFHRFFAAALLGGFCAGLGLLGLLLGIHLLRQFMRHLGQCLSFGLDNVLAIGFQC